MRTDEIALAVVLLTACVVVLDGWKLVRAHRQIPALGRFENGGMAWSSDASHEFVRNAINLGTVAVMMVAPWFLAARSGTATHWVIAFDALLTIHGLWLLLPKRYAITRDALWADGFRVDWKRIWWNGQRMGSTIVLQRRGWWRLAPIPVGGDAADLDAAALRIDAILSDQWDALQEILAEEE